MRSLTTIRFTYARRAPLLWLGSMIMILASVGCSQSDTGSAPAMATMKAPAETEAAPEPTPPTKIVAPAGTYQVDINHATLAFSVQHLGLSNYVGRFNAYDLTIELNPEDVSSSSVSVTIDPTSVDTDYVGDYQGTHPDSSFTSWEEDLAMSDKFFNAGTYPEISFVSTVVTQGEGDMLSITGDLTLLGQTHPITLDATIVGMMEAHPFRGVGAIGFSAEGSFMRSEFGMDYLLSPPLLGDEITLMFEGEFLQAQQPAAEE
ncbi:MAG: YceI family protein [Pseudomonadota bacterium]